MPVAEPVTSATRLSPIIALDPEQGVPSSNAGQRSGNGRGAAWVEATDYV
jgi:hypothetical protein